MIEKVPYTKWDHYRWSYTRDDVRNPERTTPDEVAYRSWYQGGISRQVQSFRQECLYTAVELKKYADQFDKKIRVMISGGIDSEVVAWSFRLAGIPFVPTFMEFRDGYNHHELIKAREAVNNMGMCLDIIGVDIHKIIDWSKNEIDRARYQAPISYSHRWLAKQFPDDLVVWGCGDLVMRRDHKGNSYVEFGAARHHCYDIYTYPGPYHGTEQFLHYTPEQAYAAYSHPMVKAWVDFPKAMPHPFYSTKVAMYKSEFPEITVDREKRTGAEFIRALEADFVNKHAFLAPYCVRPLVKYQTVLDQLSGLTTEK